MRRMSRRIQPAVDVDIPVFGTGARVAPKKAHPHHTVGSILRHMRGQGLRFKEISRITGMSVGTICYHLQAAQRNRGL